MSIWESEIDIDLEERHWMTQQSRGGSLDFVSHPRFRKWKEIN